MSELWTTVTTWYQTNININALDALLVLLLAIIIAFFMRRRLLGFLIGLGAVATLPFVLNIALNNLFVALGLMIVIGGVLALIANVITSQVMLPGVLGEFFGAVGGVLFGLSMLLALSISLPASLDQNRRVIYPTSLPKQVAPLARDSRIIALGRDMVLYELYANSNLTSAIQSAPPEVVGQLHDLLVVQKPWE